MRLPRRCLAIFALITISCTNSPSDGDDLGDATSTSTSTDTNDDSTIDTHGPDVFGPCECYNPPDECSAEALASTVRDCGSTATCVIEGLCPGTSPDNCGGMGECNTTLEYSGDIDCALTALRDRTAATIVLREQQFLGACGVDYGDTHTIWHVTEQGLVSSVRCTESDTGGTFWSYTRSQVENADYFDGCAAVSDTSERHACVVAGLIEPVDLSNCSHQGG